LRGVPEETLLRIVLDEASLDVALDYAIRDGALVISTRDALKAPLTLRTYGVRDLLGTPLELTGEPNWAARRLQELVDFVTRLVEPDSWEVNGGDGKIRVEAGTLLIENRPAVHDQITAAFGVLRTKPTSPVVVYPQSASLAPSADEAIRAALKRELNDVAYTDKPLVDIVADVRKRLGVNVHAQWQLLEHAGIERDKPISVKAQRLPAERVLQLVLDEAGGPDLRLGYDIRDGVLLLSTREAIGWRMELRACPVSDLLKLTLGSRAEDAEVRSAFASQLTNMVVMTVDPDSWADNGGLGTLDVVNAFLFARNSRLVCRDVERLLRALQAAPPGGHVLATPEPMVPALDKQIEDALQRVAPEVAHDRTPLYAALDALLKPLGASVHTYWQVLEDAGIERDTPVWVRVENLPVGRVLRLILDEVGLDVALGFEIRDGVLLVSTREDLDRGVETYVHRIDDLLGAFGRGRPDMPSQPEAVAEELAGVILETVVPDSWAINGGLGTLEVLGSSLVVQNSPRVGREVEEFLRALRAVSPGGFARATPRMTPPAADETIRAALDRRVPGLAFDNVPIAKVIDRLHRLLSVSVYVPWGLWQESCGLQPKTTVTARLADVSAVTVIRQVFAPFAKDDALFIGPDDGVLLIWPRAARFPPMVVHVYQVGDLLSAPAMPERLRDIIHQVIEPGSWAENAGLGTIACFGDRLIVRNTETVQQEVRALLTHIRAQMPKPTRERAFP
jgi:hypothetical protein